MVVVEPLVAVLEVAHRIIPVSGVFGRVPRRGMRARRDPRCVVGDDLDPLGQQWLLTSGRRHEARRLQRKQPDEVLQRNTTRKSDPTPTTRTLAARTRKVKRGKTKLCLVPFLTSISPRRQRTPASSAPSSDGQKKAFPTRSWNVLLLRRGAASWVASEPTAIARVRKTVVAEGVESKSSAWPSLHLSVRTSGMGDPVA